MRTFIDNNKSTLISLAVILAVFCVSACLTAFFNELSPTGFLHL